MYLKHKTISYLAALTTCLFLGHSSTAHANLDLLEKALGVYPSARQPQRGLRCFTGSESERIYYNTMHVNAIELEDPLTPNALAQVKLLPQNAQSYDNRFITENKITEADRPVGRDVAFRVGDPYKVHAPRHDHLLIVHENEGHLLTKLLREIESELTERTPDAIDTIAVLNRYVSWQSNLAEQKEAATRDADIEALKKNHSQQRAAKLAEHTEALAALDKALGPRPNMEATLKKAKQGLDTNYQTAQQTAQAELDKAIVAAKQPKQHMCYTDITQNADGNLSAQRINVDNHTYVIKEPKKLLDSIRVSKHYQAIQQATERLSAHLDYDDKKKALQLSYTGNHQPFAVQLSDALQNTTPSSKRFVWSLSTEIKQETEKSYINMKLAEDEVALYSNQYQKIQIPLELVQGDQTANGAIPISLKLYHKPEEGPFLTVGPVYHKEAVFPIGKQSRHKVIQCLWQTAQQALKENDNIQKLAAYLLTDQK